MSMNLTVHKSKIGILLIGLISIFFPMRPLAIADKCVQGNGILKTEERHIELFNRIEVLGAYLIRIQCQDKQHVELNADENLLESIITKVEGKKLLIYAKDPICTQNEIKLTIAVTDIEHMSISGSTTTTITNVNNTQLDVDIQGASELSITGKTKTFKVNLAGSANLNAQHFQSEITKISVQGAGDAIIVANKQLSVDIIGTGNVTYYGTPANIVKNIIGVGEIIKAK